jgi:PII-like signaling protein
MLNYLWIAFGSALGGMARYWCSGIAAKFTVLRGPMGFGQSSRIHTTKILRLSEDLPLIIEIVDSENKIMPFVELLDGMLNSGLMTLENVKVLRYGKSSVT